MQHQKFQHAKGSMNQGIFSLKMILHPGHSMRKFTTEVWNAYIQCLALKQDFTCTFRVVGFVKQSQNQVWLFKVVENATPNLEHRDRTHRSLHIYNISSQLYNAPVATQTCMTHSSPALFKKKKQHKHAQCQNYSIANITKHN